jgi:hypothetical protein
MSRHFQVVGDVMGDVMGDDGVEGDDYDGPPMVVGYDQNNYPIVVGARKRPRGPMVQLHKPAWRESQLAPGVIAPDQGLHPLPMGSFTYTASAQINTFQGQIQKPFRGERFLSRVVRTGTTATGTILALIFVGTDLAQLDVNELDLESLSDKQAFGVRMSMKPAQPGVFIRVKTTLDTVLTTTDTIKVTLQLLGRNIG